MSTTKTREKPPLFDWEQIALGLDAGNDEARTLVTWAKARKVEDAAKHRAAVLRLILACEELHLPALAGEALTPKQRSETLATLRYRLCEETLGLSFRLVTCNVLPLPELALCTTRAKRLLQERESAPDLESLDTTAPPEWWQGEAA